VLDTFVVPVLADSRYHLPVRRSGLVAILGVFLTLLVPSVATGGLASGSGSAVDRLAGGRQQAGEESRIAIGFKRWHPRLVAARRYARRRAGDVAFAVIARRGRIGGFRMARTAPAASVFKVMLMVAYLRTRHDRRLTQAERALLGPMIRRSDSVAATLARDAVGPAGIRRLARRARMRDFRYHAVWGLSRTSPRDQARFMFRLRSFVPARHRPYARHLLSHVVASQRWGIGRLRLRGWTRFFKGGWGSGTGRVDHQVALLKRGRMRLALAVFTQFDPSHRYGKRTLRGVAARLLRGLPVL
jgi:hypothetical protein